MKIRNKLTYKFALIVASILLVFSFSIYYFSANFREQEFDKRLIDKGLTTARLLLNVDEVDMKLLRIIDRNNLTAFQNEKITIYDSLFQKIYSSDDDPETPLDGELISTLKDEGQIFFNHNQNEVIGIPYQEGKNKFYIIVSAFDKYGINKLKNLRLVLGVGFFISIGILFIAGWIFSGQAMKPVSRIINDVNEISISNLHRRINEGNGQDELAQLAIKFNMMLSRLEQAFEMQKSFVANSSHELRTPLSTIRAQLEVSLNEERSLEEYKEILTSVLEDINHLIKLTNGLLDLSQVEFDISRHSLKKLRMDELVIQCISEISKKYPNQTIEFNIDDNLDEESMFIVLGNEHLLKTAILNIIDNACKFSNNNPAEVIIGSRENEMVILIKDKGIGIKQAELNHIYAPFYRGSNVRNIMGTGIGLPLSKKIIELHEGSLDMISKQHEGTTAIVHLPIRS